MPNEVSGIIATRSNQRTKDLVLVILSESFPLSIKELYSKVSRQGNNVTYQAVHKVVQNLIETDIVEKNGKGIQLSKKWIDRVKDYAFTVDTVYTKGKNHRLPTEFTKPYSVIFDDLSAYVVWLAENFRDGNFTRKKPMPVFGIFYHAIWPLRFNFKDFELLREMTSNCRTKGISVCDDPLDKWVCNHYKLGGVAGFKTGVPIKTKENHFSVGDIVVRAKFSPKTIAFMDDVYSRIGDLKQLFQFYFTEGKKESTEIEITIEHNPTVARMIENQVLQALKEE